MSLRTAAATWASGRLLPFLFATGAVCAQPLGAVTALRGATIEGWVCGLDPAGPAPAVDLFLNGTSERADGSLRPPWERYRGPNLRPDHWVGVAEATPAPTLELADCPDRPWRFRFTVPREQRSAAGPGSHQLHAALRLAPGRWHRLTGSPQTLVVRGRTLAVLPWIESFRVACMRRKSKHWPMPAPNAAAGEAAWSIGPPLGDCATAASAWVLESTNETRSFGPLFDAPGRRNDTDVDLAADPRPTAPWRVRFQARPGGGHRLVSTVDRRLGPGAGTPFDAYLAAMVQTELGAAAPSLAQPLFVELAYRVRETLTAPIDAADVAGGHVTASIDELTRERALAARWRATLGLLVTGGAGVSLRFVEVNLAASRAPHGPGDATASFDLCDGSTTVEGLQPALACERADAAGGDETGLFDRRSAAVPIVYVDSAQLHRIQGPPQPTSTTGDGWSLVRVSVDGLVRNLPWLDRPGLSASLPLRGGRVDTSGLVLRAFYLGSETWGKARVVVEFERLRLFRFTAD